MSTFYGYPLPKPSHGYRDKQRPWWVRQGSPWLQSKAHWLRSDGLGAKHYLGNQCFVSGPGIDGVEEPDGLSGDELLGYCDARWPMPVPPPLCGQVWVYEDNATLLGVECGQAVGSQWIERPRGVLVYGPFAPWAPPNWSPPQES